MSTTKIIKGYIRPVTVGRLIANPYGLESPLWEDDIYGNATPATLYIGTGKLWTEEEVVRIVERIRNNVYFMDRDNTEKFIRQVAKESGLIL